MSIIYFSLYTTINVPSYYYICVLILLYKQGMECGTFFFLASLTVLCLCNPSVGLSGSPPPFSPILV